MILQTSIFSNLICVVTVLPDSVPISSMVYSLLSLWMGVDAGKFHEEDSYD